MIVAPLLTLSDDGKALYNVSGTPLAKDPAIRLFEPRLFYGDRPGTILASSQDGEGLVATATPIAAPDATRALYFVFEKGNHSTPGFRRFVSMVRFEGRGPKTSSAAEVAPYTAYGWRRAIRAGIYEVGVWKEGATVYRVSVEGERLSVRRTGSIAPSAFPPKLFGYGGGVVFATDGTLLGQVATKESKTLVHEWSFRQRAWRHLNSPFSLTIRPRILYLRRRLFAVPDAGGPAFGTYEAKADRSGWRKVSDRTLLTISANGRFCLVRSPFRKLKVERFSTFAGKG